MYFVKFLYVKRHCVSEMEMSIDMTSTRDRVDELVSISMGYERGV